MEYILRRLYSSLYIIDTRVLGSLNKHVACDRTRPLNKNGQLRNTNICCTPPLQYVSSMAGHNKPAESLTINLIHYHAKQT